MDILLTNDDGIEESGLRALYSALSELGDVTCVAPADDQSAVGRSMSYRVGVQEHDLGYAIEGTPTDCVVAGLQALAPEVDLVVSGCNRGANLGEYVLGRSGTVSAAVEATFFETPAIAVSMYVPPDIDFQSFDPDETAYETAAKATSYLAGNSIDSGLFNTVDYLNVNAPMAMDGDGMCPMEVTEPSTVYDMDAVTAGDSADIVLRDRLFERMGESPVSEPPGTDRRAVVEGRVSVSPLSAPQTTNHHSTLASLAEQYDGRDVKE